VSARSPRRLSRLGIELPLPEGAEERAWLVVRAAFEERVPAPRRRSWKPAVAVALAAVVVVAALSPPGRAVLDSIRETVGVEHAQPALFSLPAPGRLLVEADSGAWVAGADGAKRRLGDWREAAWSPFGRFVVASRANELAALEPDGKVRWTLSRRAVRAPAWGGTRTDTRIAYLSGSTLRVVAGDGTGDRLVARGVVAGPAWRPGPGHVLAYVARDGRLHVVDGDRGTPVAPARPAPGATDLQWLGKRLLVVSPAALRLFESSGRTVLTRGGRFAAAALAPDGRSVAVVRRGAGGSAVDVVTPGAVRRVFAGTGSFQDVGWSPDGRWLLVTWRDADQWVFVRVAGGRRIRPVGNVSRQFDSARFPAVRGWCCAR
jgi:hypothetical protein